MEHISNKADVLQRIHGRWDALWTLVNGLSAEQINEPLGNGWSTKAHIAHIAAWETSTAALLHKEHRGDALGVSRDAWTTHDIDTINDVIAERVATRDWADVQRESLAAHDDLIARVDSMTQKQLEQPYSDYAPYDPPYNATPVIAWVNGNTWDHYNEHIGWISEGLHVAD